VERWSAPGGATVHPMFHPTMDPDIGRGEFLTEHHIITAH